MSCCPFELSCKIRVKRAQERGLRAYVGNTLTNDHFYIDNKLEYSKQWERYGILASEQEGVALYTAAALYGARSCCCP